MHWCPGHLFSTRHNQRKKCTYTRASTPVRWCSNFLAMQTISTNLATGALPKKPTESTPAHGAVAAVLSHRHHLIIRFGAGPVQFVYGLYSKLGHGAYPSQNSISTIVFAGFFIFLCNFLLWPGIWNYYLVILAWFRWDEKNSKNLMIFWWRSVLHHSKILHF